MEKLEKKEKLKEIKKITAIIIERYELYDYYLASRVAKKAYLNGIGLDKFNQTYYAPPFSLDEIILYLIEKEKILSLSNQTPSSPKTSFKDNRAKKVVPLTRKRKPQRFPRNHYHNSP